MRTSTHKHTHMGTHVDTCMYTYTRANICMHLTPSTHTMHARTSQTRVHTHARARTGLDTEEAEALVGSDVEEVGTQYRHGGPRRRRRPVGPREPDRRRRRPLARPRPRAPLGPTGGRMGRRGGASLLRKALDCFRMIELSLLSRRDAVFADSNLRIQIRIQSGLKVKTTEQILNPPC